MFLRSSDNFILSDSKEITIYYPQPEICYIVTQIKAPSRIYSEEFEISYNGRDWNSEIVVDLSYSDLYEFEIFVRPGNSDIGKVIIDAAEPAPIQSVWIPPEKE